jgi:phosphatidate cytidylyltransferase
VLRWRLISAAVILTVLLALLWLDYRQVYFGTPGAWLLPLLLVVSVLATEEVLSLLRAQGHRPIGWIVYAGNVAIPLAAGLPVVLALCGSNLLGRYPHIGYVAPLATLAIFGVSILAGEISRFQQPGAAITNAALGIFGLLYIGVLISFWAFFRLQGGNEWGMAALFSMLLIVKMADTGAFAFGKAFGRHKMTPILSPGKTWEGTFGGIATAIVTSWAFFHFLAPKIVSAGYVEPPLAVVAAYGGLMALAGIVGDLAESLLKRDMRQKDSSTWLRGLGGVLDIIDAPLVAGVVAWICWTAGLIGPS